MPTISEVLDSYLNTGDYDDAFDGWVSVAQIEDVIFCVKFEPNSADTPAKSWHLVVFGND